MATSSVLFPNPNYTGSTAASSSAGASTPAAAGGATLGGTNFLTLMLAQLKNQCGAGGTLDGETLELQGNHIERLRTLLRDAGYGVAR